MPWDFIGPYVEATGLVIAVESIDQDDPEGQTEVTIRTPDGSTARGWILSRRAPKVGYTATIRLYEAGGGWYPDDRVTSWSSPPLP